MNIREQHPRPRMTRTNWIDLCGEWGFTFDPENKGLSEQWFEGGIAFDRIIIVPFPPESPASGINDKTPHLISWYAKSFSLPSSDVDQTWILHFGAVDYRSQVWLNGHRIVAHEGGNTPFSVDIGPYLNEGANVLVVRVEDDPHDRTQPRGKQYWRRDPGEIWYHRTSGIWQPVWLEPVARTHIIDVRWRTDLVAGRIGMTVTLNQTPNTPLRLGTRLTLGDLVLADDTTEIRLAETTREYGFEIPGVTIERDAMYWSPEFPNLVDAELTLTRAGEPIDTVSSYLGLRSVATGDRNFFLNGRPYYLRTALAQGYWPQTHLAAPSGEAIRHEVQLAKELGFNGLRLHQKVEDPRYLYWCDRLGVLVWGEMANAYTFSPTAVERFAREWIDVVHRDVSHPCIVAWVPFNESWGVPNLEFSTQQRAYVRAITQLTHALDPSRPVIGNDGWELFSSDIWGIHDYNLDASTIVDRYQTEEAVLTTLRTVRPYFQALISPDQEWTEQPVMLTEVGGIDYIPNDDGTAPRQQRRAYTEQEFLKRLGSLMDAILGCAPVRGFCYTQLCDTEQEKSGLLTSDRQPKIDPALIRAIFTGPASAISSEAVFGPVGSEA